MEDEPKIEQIDELDKIKVSDYENLGQDHAEWLEHQEIPSILWDKIKNPPLSTTVKSLLLHIRSSLFEIYGENRDKARNFQDSRFTSLSDMITRGMTSCGVMANIFGNALRQLGIPTKFIHGKMWHQKELDNRHAWLEIYNPLHKIWIEIDPTGKDFEKALDAARYRTYHNWEELRKDFDEGEY